MRPNLMIELLSKTGIGKCSCDRRTEKIFAAKNKSWALELEEDLLIMGDARQLKAAGEDTSFLNWVDPHLIERAKTVGHVLAVCELMNYGLHDTITTYLRTEASDADFRVLICNYGYNMSFRQISDKYMTPEDKIQRIYRDAMLRMTNSIIDKQIDLTSQTIVTYEDILMMIYQMTKEPGTSDHVKIQDVADHLGCSAKTVHGRLYDQAAHYHTVGCNTDHEGNTLVGLTKKGKGLAEILCERGGVFHPGVVVETYARQQYEENLAEFANAAEIAPQELKKIFSGEEDIDRSIAEHLGKVFDCSATFWKLLQAYHDQANDKAADADSGEDEL